MKKIFLVAGILSLLLTAGCKKKKGVEDKILVPETISENETSSLFTGIMRDIKGIEKQITSGSSGQARVSGNQPVDQHFVYRSDHLRLIDHVNLSDGKVKTYFYADLNEGLLDSIVGTDANGQVDYRVYYTYDNGRIKRVETVHADGSVEYIEVTSYNGDYPASVNVVTPQTVLSGSVTFSDGNLTDINLSGQMGSYNVTFRTTFNYDDKKNTFTYVETKDDITKSKNNVISSTESLTINGYPYITITNDYSYQYNDQQLPESYTRTENNGSSTTTYEGQIDYKEVN